MSPSTIASLIATSETSGAFTFAPVAVLALAVLDVVLELLEEAAVVELVLVMLAKGMIKSVAIISAACHRSHRRTAQPPLQPCIAFPCSCPSAF
jgi:hypothetical protein